MDDCITFDELNVGNVLKVQGDSGTWYGIITAITNNEITIMYLVANGEMVNGRPVYKFEEAYNTIEIESIIEFYNLSIRRSLLQYGFVRRDKDYWVLYDNSPVDEDSVSIEYLSSNDSSDSDEEDTSDQDDMGDFIVSDDNEDIFTEACDDSDFVRSTHTAVGMYNDWVPSSSLDKKIKDIIDNIEYKAKIVEDNKNFK